MFDLIIEGRTTEQTYDGLSEREVRARFAQHLAGAVQATVIDSEDGDTDAAGRLTDELRLILSMNVTPEEVQAYAREVADTGPVSRNAWAAVAFGEWFDMETEPNEFLAYKALVLAVADELIDDRIRGEMDTETGHMTDDAPAARLAQVRVNSALLEAEKIGNARSAKAYAKNHHVFRPNPYATAISMGAVQRAVDGGASTVAEIVEASFVGRLRADVLRVLKNRGQL